MIEQVQNHLRFYAFFTATKQGATGLTVTADVYTPVGSPVVTDGGCTEIGGGLYRYVLNANSVTFEGEYIAVFKTADGTVDQQHVPSLWVVGKAGVEHLDADVSTVAADPTAIAEAVVQIGPLGDYANGGTTDQDANMADGLIAALSVPAVPGAVWEEATADHTTQGSMGEWVGQLLPLGAAGAVWNADPVTFIPNSAGTLLSTAGTGGSDPLAAVVPGSYVAGTAGYNLGHMGVGDVVFVGPVASDGGTLSLVRGDDYTEALNREITLESTDWPDLTDATLTMTVRRRREAFGTGSDGVLFTTEDVANSRVTATSPQTVVFELHSADTAALLPGVATGKFDVQAVLSDNSVVTLITGLVTVVEDQTR